MDFARKQLEKYGWKDGDGLGKTGTGISKALKPKLKFDHAGLGHKLSDDIINPWWQRVYDSAAKNVDVSSDGNSVHVKTNGNDVEITTNRKRSKRKHKNTEENGYGNFVLKASLTSKGEKAISTLKNSENSDEEEKVSKKRTSGICDMTDEELFKACGGRTVHKGARHGLSMSAKLARLEQQESFESSSRKKKKKKRKSSD